MDHVDRAAVTKSCPLAQNDRDFHFHCSGCTLCGGTSEELPRGWYYVTISRELGESRLDAPHYALCPDCMTWQWEVLGEHDPEFVRIQTEARTPKEKMARLMDRALEHLADPQMERRYTVLIQRDPSAARYFRRRGRIRRNRGNFEGAQADFSRAIEIEATKDHSDHRSDVAVSLAASYLERGRTSLQRGDLKGAEADFHDATHAHPGLPHLSALWARLYHLQGEHELSAWYVDLIHEQEPGLGGELRTDALRFVSAADRFAEKGEGEISRRLYECALFETDLALTVDPRMRDVNLCRGVALFGLGRGPEARSALLAELATHPHNDRAKRVLATLDGPKEV